MLQDNTIIPSYYGDPRLSKKVGSKIKAIRTIVKLEKELKEATSSLEEPSNSSSSPVIVSVPENNVYEATFKGIMSGTVIDAYVPEGVTTISNIFAGSTTLATVTLPSTTTFIAAEAFKDCTSLTTVTCLAGESGVPTLSADAFSGCTNLAHIYVPESYVNDYKAATEWITHTSIIEAIPNA